MKVVIAPAYHHLESFISAIPQGDYPCEKEKVLSPCKVTTLINYDGE